MQAAGALQVWQTAENMVLGGVVLPAVFVKRNRARSRVSTAPTWG